MRTRCVPAAPAPAPAPIAARPIAATWLARPSRSQPMRGTSGHRGTDTWRRPKTAGARSRSRGRGSKGGRKARRSALSSSSSHAALHNPTPWGLAYNEASIETSLDMSHNISLNPWAFSTRPGPEVTRSIAIVEAARFAPRPSPLVALGHFRRAAPPRKPPAAAAAVGAAVAASGALSLTASPIVLAASGCRLPVCRRI